MKKNIPIFSFVGYSGSGKTTFIEKLIPELKKHNLRIAVLKHDSHEFEMDKEGKDTWRFFNAGADSVSISSKTKSARINRYEQEPDFDSLIRDLNVDLILTEGYRDTNVPKIAVHRKATGHSLSVLPEQLIAIITDFEDDYNIPSFDLKDFQGFTNFLLNIIYENEIPEGVSLETGLKLLLKHNPKLNIKIVGLEESLDQIAAETIVSQMMIPSFNRSPLDGYAIISDDSINATKNNPVTLKIIEEIPAGKDPLYKVNSGQAAKILTGAPIPEGADAVVKFEDTSFTKDEVTIFNNYKKNSNIVFAGEDMSTGEIVVSKGEKITPPIMGVMSSLGITHIQVYETPVVSIINTGSELKDIYSELKKGEIRNSSYYNISSVLRNTGFSVINGGCVRDDPETIAKKIFQMLPLSNVVLTTGGVSVGDYDFMKDTLELMGAEILFWRLNIKPGGAVLAAMLNDTMIISLSGNPGSAIVCMEVLARPYLRKLQGYKEIQNKKIQVRMYNNYNKPSPNGRFLRGRMIIEDGVAFFEERGSQKNGSLSSMIDCNLLGIVPKGTIRLNKNDLIDAYII